MECFCFFQTFVENKEQLLRELDMYQEIAVARGPEYDSLNQTMDHCQENIETLSDEIQRLQGKTSFVLVRKRQTSSLSINTYWHMFSFV